MFPDCYAEAICTVGRANFITGEIPPRTGLTTVGQAGADVGIPDQAATMASALKALVIFITSTLCPILTGLTIRRIGSPKLAPAT